MKHNELFRTRAAKLNESMYKQFGKKLNLEGFDIAKLEDARNKLRTQIHDAKTSKGFNENLESDVFHQAQAMLDVLNAELLEREESAIDNLEVPATNPQAEATETGEDMKVTEGEIQQASAIVTAKTMVDRVGRWIEELSGMENETLLQLGDSIRDEMGAEQSKAFIEASAPAIQQALENLKQTRETLATSIRQLTGEEAATGMLGAEPEEGGETDMAAPAEPMDAEAPAEDDFAAAEPSAGGMETAGREKRESINYESNLLRTLAG
jgi:hypothetical protein